MLASRLTTLLVAFLLCTLSTFAQTRTITGRVTEQDGKGIPGVTVSVRGTSAAVQTKEDGTFSISAEDSSTLVFSSVGYTSTEVNVAGRSSVSAILTSQNANLSEVVVIGYGTARRRDVTGSVATVSSKDFNKGIQTAPDQLIQGKVPGVQILNNSGMPGGETTVRIRGAASIRAGNQPLFVLDGVPLDNSSAKPGSGNVAAQIGDRIPGTNPLNFLNPNDIASIDVLKDASATAIYGSRGANGVVLITTRKGTGSTPRIDFNASTGFSNVMKRLDVLNASEYRAGLQQYNLGNANDFGADVDAFDEITRTGFTQTYSVSASGGSDVGRFRVSLGYMDQEGIVRKTGLKKYTAYLNGGFRFLESKRLGFDVTVLGTQLIDNTAPISQNAGFEGSLIGQALQWNPTKPVRNPDGALNVDIGGSIFNPLAVSEAYNDESKVSNVLAIINPSFKITNDLEYRFIGSVNFGVGDRRQWIANFINFRDIQRTFKPDGTVDNLGGAARLADQQNITRQVTNTLNYTKDITQAFSINALIGHEYLKSDSRGNDIVGMDFPDLDYPYYDFFQSTDPDELQHGFFVSPTIELQSFFGRAQVNLRDKYIVTATLRGDGSSKFGRNNRYGYFPSFAGAWNISSEDFFEKGFINTVKLRVGWGKTGNQEFPAGASQRRYGLSFGRSDRLQLENPDLKWETATTTNAGVDFTLWNNRIVGTIDWFRKVSKDILFLADAPDPAVSGGRKWVNLAGEILNSGVEFGVNTSIIQQQNFSWDFGVNATYLKNELTGLIAPLETGEINGQGLSETRSQLFANGQPLNVFYLKTYNGIDKNTGIGVVTETRSFAGNPNPDVLLGISTRASYGKLGLEINMNGAFGHQIYNNTANALLTVNNIGIGRNTTADALSAGESLASPIAASTRYLENGNYMKLANATLSYRLGNVRAFRNANIYVTGQNLFVLTNYSGFDPEVNTNKIFQDLPSFGIEYTPYPTARTVTLGVNFSF
jgi:iron complex outermembrane receptor protein